MIGSGVEFPQLRAGHHIESARIAGRALRVFQAGCADYRDIAMNRWHAAKGHADIHLAAFAKTFDQLAGRRIERHHHVRTHHVDARRHARLSGPIAEPAARIAAPAAAARALIGDSRRFMHPDFRASGRIQRHHAVLRGDIHAPVHHQRNSGVEGAKIIGPCLAKLAHIGAGDFGQRGIAGGGKVTIDGRPIASGNRFLRQPGGRPRRCQHRCNQKACCLAHQTPLPPQICPEPPHIRHLHEGVRPDFVDSVLKAHPSFDNGLRALGADKSGT